MLWSFPFQQQYTLHAFINSCTFDSSILDGVSHIDNRHAKRREMFVLRTLAPAGCRQVAVRIHKRTAMSVGMLGSGEYIRLAVITDERRGEYAKRFRISSKRASRCAETRRWRSAISVLANDLISSRV